MVAFHRVAISGAGPAGLVVASIVARECPGVEIDVFDRDPKDRDQGAGWDIDNAAKKTFERAGFDYRKIARHGSDTWRIFRHGDQMPVACFSLPRTIQRWTGSSNPETNRQAMREELLRAIGSGANVQFDCPVCDVEEAVDGSGRVVLQASDGQQLGEYDLVIDAAGMHSRLRKHRVDEDSTAQYYNNLTFVNGIIDNPEDMLDPELVRMLGEGTLEVNGNLADGTGGFIILLQRYGAQPEDKRAKLMTLHIRDRPGQLADELCLAGIPKAHITASEHPEAVMRLQSFLKEKMGAAWAKMYHDLVDCLDTMQVFDIHQFPADVTLKQSSLPLICIGDALHAMSPTSGSGGNLAVQDANDVATYLVASQGKTRSDVLQGLRDIEKRCLQRSKEPADMGVWCANRFKKVLTSQLPVEEYFTGRTPFSDLPTVMCGVVSLIQWMHWLEGYGMPSRL